MIRRLLLGFAALACAAAVAAPIAPEDRRSGYDFMSRATQAMQDDELTGPAVFALAEGESLWAQKAGGAGRSCADCHGDARSGLKGVAARYPAMAVNPLIAFTTVATESGELVFRWTGDRGYSASHTARIVVD